MISIQQLSHEVGIGVDTLRIWERRYGYPQPRRNPHGHRRYPLDQRDELRIVRKLQDLGERPGRIFALTPQQRRARLKKLLAGQRPAADSLRRLAVELPVTEIAPALRTRLAEEGIENFIHRTTVPLLQLLGFGWTEGSISIAREHFISDLLEDILRNSLQLQQLPENAPKILCLTLSGERHRLGLLLAAALFQQQGCRSILLQEDLPLDEIPPLVEEFAVAAVALSFSIHYPASRARRDLALLRKRLSPAIGLIAGGQALAKGPYLQGIEICTELAEIPRIRRRVFGAAPEGA